MRMNRVVWAIAGMLAVSSVLPAQAVVLRCRLISTTIKAEVNKVNDVNEHYIGTYIRKGLMLHDNGEVASEVNHGIVDMVNGIEKWEGYCEQTFKDGSMMVMKYQGRGANDKILEASFEFVKGTGRFEGLKGKGTFSGGDFGGFGDYRFTGTYTVKQ